MNNIELYKYVREEKGQVFTTSRMVAAKFSKQHKDVLKAIQNLECSSEFRERNFAPSSYVSAQGKEMPEFRLTRDGYMILCMGFTGSEAMRIKEAFIGAFNAMEKALGENAPQSLWLSTRSQGKQMRSIETQVIAEFIEYARAQGSTQPEFYYANFSKMVNKALIDTEGKKIKNMRDSMNVAQLTHIYVAEHIIAKSIVECMTEMLPYKDVYQIAKSKIEKYSETVGKSKLGQTLRQSVGLLN